MRVIITGAAGYIGKQITEELAGVHELCLVDRRSVPGCRSIVAQLARSGVVARGMQRLGLWSPRWKRAFAGADAVLHLAADARPSASWKSVLRDNIQATHSVLMTAVRHEVDRVVFASSNWAVKALERELAPACYTAGGPKIDSHAPPRPITGYGISKAFGEIMGRMLVDEGRLKSFVAVRIGSYQPLPPQDEVERRLWIGTHDLRCLLRRCVEEPFEGFHVVYGVSAQPEAPYDLSHTCSLLSWKPQHLPRQTLR